jgi:hypothetical protein
LELSAPETARDIGIFSVAEKVGSATRASTGEPCLAWLLIRRWMLGRYGRLLGQPATTKIG